MPAEAAPNPEPIRGDKNSPSGCWVACLEMGKQRYNNDDSVTVGGEVGEAGRLKSNDANTGMV